MKFVALKTLQQVENLSKTLLYRKEFSVDIETTSTDAWRDKIVGIGFCWDKGGAVYVPIRHKYDQPFDGEKALELLRIPLIECSLYGFNLLFDLEFLEHDAKIINEKPSIDTGLLAYVKGEFPILSLKAVSKILCPEVGVRSYADFMKDLELHIKKNTIAEAPIKEVANYCGRDALATYLLKQKLYPILKDNKIYKLEKEVFPVTRWLRRNGVMADKKFFTDDQKRLEGECDSLGKLIEAQVSEVVGEKIEFNIGSSQQLGKVLFDLVKIPCKAYTKTGQPKVDKFILSDLKWDYPFVKNVIIWKEMKKRATTFYKKYLSFVQEDGRIHASYNQTGVPSGRYSCSDPNLQNIPREKAWKIYRKGQKSPEIPANTRCGFIVSDDSWLLEFDYSQIEARVAAGLTREPILLNTFKDNIDYHIRTASLVFNVPLKSVTKDQRYLGKTLNFALAYGMGTTKFYHKLREHINVTYEKAKAMRKKYLESYPRMFHEAEMIAKAAERTHSVDTWFGRRVPIFLFASAMDNKSLQEARREAYNQVIQGTAADIVKLGMVRIFRLIKDKYGLDKAKLILQSHDGLAFEVSKEIDLQAFASDGKRVLRYEIDGFPEFPVEVAVGENWGELKKMEKPKMITLQPEKRLIFEIPQFVISESPNFKGQLQALRNLLLDNPGNNELAIKIGERLSVFPDRVSFTVEDMEKFTVIIEGKLYEKKTEG